MGHQISRSVSLSSIPERKIIDALEQTIRSCAACSSKPNIKLDHNLCDMCRLNNKRIQRYADANIPVIYWHLEMESNFHGDPSLKEKYLEITKDLRKSYQEGIAICFAGGHGRGKTMTCCNILKRAVEKNFSGLYVNLNDIVSVMLNRDSDDRGTARRELLMVDFLVIDEFDSRYMSNDKASDLFGKILEEIFRTRSQNSLPILMCTNDLDVKKSFTGAIKESIDSLMNTVKTVPVLGRDQRVVNASKGQK